MKTQKINILEQSFFLHPYKSIFWEEKKTLILSDLHLGKAAHFRKSGIPIPASVHDHDYYRLEKLIQFYEPEMILFLGDLFHSDLNDDCRQFCKWMSKYGGIEFVLVKGNHDILEDEHYGALKVMETLTMEPFVFSHKPDESFRHLYNICGHIHPSVSVSSGPRQSSRVSCFYFGKNVGILPSFGNFTGNSKISIKFEDKVYLIFEEMVLPFNNISLSA